MNVGIVSAVGEVLPPPLAPRVSSVSIGEEAPTVRNAALASSLPDACVAFDASPDVASDSAASPVSASVLTVPVTPVLLAAPSSSAVPDAPPAPAASSLPDVPLVPDAPINPDAPSMAPPAPAVARALDASVVAGASSVPCAPSFSSSDPGDLLRSEASPVQGASFVPNVSVLDISDPSFVHNVHPQAPAPALVVSDVPPDLSAPRVVPDALPAPLPSPADPPQTPPVHDASVSVPSVPAAPLITSVSPETISSDPRVLPTRSVLTSGESVPLGEHLTFDARLSGVDCDCVLDPGSSISIISKTLYDTLPDLTICESATVAKVANGEPLSLLGQCTIPLAIGRREFSVRFQVSDSLDVPCLVGLDFLEQVPSVIDLVNRRLIFVPSNAVRFVSAEARAVGRVVLGRDVSVSPGSEQILQGYVHSCDYNGPTVFEPTLSIPGLEATRALSCVENGKVPVVVRNISAAHITIPRNTPVGDLEVDFIEEPFEPTVGPDPSAPPVDFDNIVNTEGTGLNPSQRDRLIAVLKRYEPMFDGHLGLSDLVTHDIETGNAPPVRQPHRRIPPHIQPEVKEQLDELVRLGVLIESNGSWASPICVVRKRSGKARVVCDMRRLNAVTELPAYPIPKIADVLEGLKGATMFCTLDMNMAYYQVRINPEHQHKATITTPWNNYAFTRMCFGLSGASFTCARLLNLVLGDIIPDKCLCYFDDVIVRGSSLDELLENLDAVLNRMGKAGLTLNLAKCLFCQPKVTFLGHVVSGEGLSPDPVKVEAVLAWPPPRTAKQMASFLGLSNYFKNYIKGYAVICAPLFRLCNRDVRFEWTGECQLAFDRLKRALTEAPVLTLPAFDDGAGDFILECDASGSGVGAVLLQMTSEGEKVIAYGSKKLSKAQRNYSATKRELLACVEFVTHFKHYLIGKKFWLRTDHSSLQWLYNFRSPTGILARWIEILSSFDFEIQFKKGTSNGAADALSRMPSCTADAATQTESVPQTFRVSDSAHWSLSFIRAEQEADPAISELSAFLSRGQKPPRRQVKHCASLLRQWHRLRLVNGVVFRLYRRRPKSDDELQVVLPSSLRTAVLESLHGGPSGGHFGPEKLLAECRLRFFWDHMEDDIKDFCRQCRRCEGRNPPVPAPRAGMGRLFASRPFEVVGLDILTGLPSTPSGNKHLLVVIDFFSKWAEAFPLKDLAAATVANVFVDEFVARFGCPERVHSDQGGCFVSEILDITCKRLGIGRSTISGAHPSGNGVVERVNRTVLAMLSKLLDDDAHNRWDEHIPLLMLAYRAQASRTTGFSPYKLIMGREPRLPVEADLELPTNRVRSNSTAEYFDRLRESLRIFHGAALRRSDARHSTNKRAYDQRLNELSFSVGECVLLHRAVVPRGQYYKFLRPYKRAVILDKLSPLNYRVRPDGARKTITVHHNRLSKVRPTPAPRVQASS